MLVKTETDLDMKKMARCINIFLIFHIVLSVNSFAQDILDVDFDSNEESCFSSEERFPVMKNALMSSESLYMEIMNKFKRKFSPMVAAQYGKQLKFEYRPNEDRVNASITRDDDNNPVLIITSGLIMFPQMSPNAFVAILCHELGHFMGGLPKKLRGNTNLKSWSSAEGQADYFASSKCLPEYYSGEKSNDRFAENVKKEQLDELYHICSEPLCMRVVHASLEMSRVFAEIKKFSSLPSLNKKDSSRVSRTNFKHPTLQCRLDTLVNGVLCDVDTEEMFSDDDPNVGACVGEVRGSRPRCWYNPTNPSF